MDANNPVNISAILYEMTRLSQSSTLVEKNLLYVIESISKLFNFSHLLFAYYDNTSKKLISQFVLGFNEEDSKQIISSELDIDPSFFSVSSVKVPVDPIAYFKTVKIEAEKHFFSNPEVSAMLLKNAFTSYFLMPMLAFGRLMGVIIAFKKDERGPGETALQNLSILVQIATLISENINLKIAESQKITKMTTLYEISQQTKNILKPADALSSLVDVVKSLIDYNICALYIMNREKNELALKEFRGNDPSFLGSEIPMGIGPIGEAAQSKIPLLSHHGIYKSFLVVPVIVDENLVGVIAIGSYKSYAYNDDDKITVKILSSQIASIDNLFLTLLNIRTYTESIMESMPLGIITIDMNGNINIINQIAKLYLNLTRYSQQDIVGRNFAEIIDRESTIPGILSDSLSKGFVFENFEIYNKKNKMTFEITTFQFKNSEGARLGIAMFIRDISKMRQMEEHIRRTDRLSAVGELASGIAHEIRNPLTGIKMMIQIIDKEFEKREAKRNPYTRAILDEIDRLDNIISNLLNFARPSKPEFCDTPVMEVIESTIFLLQSKIDSQNITIIREYPEKPFIIKCDPAQIKQVFFNICQNAIQAMSDSANKIIKIATREDDQNFLISISDTGCGISIDNYNQIFNPFFTTKDNGTGLGLAIVHRILEEHRASIIVESEIGRGATFTIKMPKSY